MMPDVSVVIPCRNDHRVLATVESVLRTVDTPGTEIIVVDDGSSNGCCSHLPLGPEVIRTPGYGVARAKNVGAAAAQGTWLAFCDAHMTFCEGWIEVLREELAGVSPYTGMATPTIVADTEEGAHGCGMTFEPPDPVPQFACAWLHPEELSEVPIGAGMCQFWDREVFRNIGQFTDSMMPWGGEDIEICLRARMLGFTVLAVPQVRVKHAFRATFDANFDIRAAVANDLKTALIHFSASRLTRILNELQARWAPADFEVIFNRAASPDILRLRQAMFAERIMSDDEWFAAMSAAGWIRSA